MANPAKKTSPTISLNPCRILTLRRRCAPTLTNGWFFDILPDLNTENPFVVEYLIQNSIWWAETSGFDGFRIDTFPYVSRKFWAEWHSGLRKYYPRLSTIGEVFHPDPTVTSFFVGGQRVGTASIRPHHRFRFPVYFFLRDVLVQAAPRPEKSPIFCARILLYPHPDLLGPFFANHDVTRFASAKDHRTTKVKFAFALTLTLRGIPNSITAMKSP